MGSSSMTTRSSSSASISTSIRDDRCRSGTNHVGRLTENPEDLGRLLLPEAYLDLGDVATLRVVVITGCPGWR
jgi:hypothetical protein